MGFITQVTLEKGVLGAFSQGFLSRNMNNNIDIANFDKMLELAEFGAKRHNERRQNLFKVIISYITLLVLVFYQAIKNENILNSDGTGIWIVVLLVVVHIVYLVWLWTTLVASINDARRRDFYLKKAESLSYHLSQSRFSSFDPDSCKDVKLNMGSGKSWKINEHCLFEMKGPKIIGRAEEEKPSPPKWFKDIHFLALSVLPTAVLLFLMTKLIGMWWTLFIPLNLIQLVVICIALVKFFIENKEKTSKGIKKHERYATPQ